MNSVFVLSDGHWRAMFNNRLARTVWTTQGPAQAWLKRCERHNKFFY